MIFDDAIRSGQLSQSDLAVVSYIREHPHDVAHMTAQELGEAAFVSASTVVRMCKKAGFRSFVDMKVELVRELSDEESFASVDSDFPRLGDANENQITMTISSMEREAIRKTERLLARVDWEPILRALDEASSITIIAAGFSLAAAQVFAENMRRIGKHVTMPKDVWEAGGWAGACPRAEIFIFVSYSGLGTHLEAPLEVLNKRGMKSIAITSDVDCPLRRSATWHLPMALTERRHMYNRTAPFQSSTAEAYVLNTLYAQLFSRNYRKYREIIDGMLKLQGVALSLDSRGEVVLGGTNKMLNSYKRSDV